ncbi:DUF1569 domain-containing protein [Leptospira sp. 96542]|nr:DUF1569 domain-containing protein [Leptospira sp. 96542]
MKTNLKFKSIDEVEIELKIISACERKQKSDITLSQIFDFLAESIELSIQTAGDNSQRGTLNKILGKYKLAKLFSIGGISSVNQVPGFPPKNDLGDENLALLRLKTALTAFKLHSGPFGLHLSYGVLDKKQWEKVHSYLAGFLFGYIKLFGDEKLRFQIERESKKERMHLERKQTHQSQTDTAVQKKPEKNQNGNPNRKWKNKKKNYHKGNRNQGGNQK